MLIIVGGGYGGLKQIQEEKQKHTWSLQIMGMMLDKTSLYEYENNGRCPNPLPFVDTQETTPFGISENGDVYSYDENFLTSAYYDDYDQLLPSNDFPLANQSKIAKRSNWTKGYGQTEKALEVEKNETPILIAAKNGVIELVKMILELFPVAIHDVNSEKKNVVLLAVENRQPNVCLLLLRLKMKETIFRNVDRDGNSALHLAAKLGDNQPWGIPGAALQMQWEMKWFKFVESLMPWRQVRYTYNAEGKTPQELFTESHKHLVEAGGAWLTRTSESWSAVAVLIATVAFTTSSAIPGGVNQDTGIPTLERQPIFGVLLLLCALLSCHL